MKYALHHATEERHPGEDLVVAVAPVWRLTTCEVSGKAGKCSFNNVTRTRFRDYGSSINSQDAWQFNRK